MSEQLNTVLDYQLDEDARRIYLFEEFSEELLQRIVPILIRMAETAPDPITLICTSPGGTVTAMFALGDIILGLPVDVNLQAYGSICSAATILLAVCRRREVAANCQVVLHGFRTHLDGGYTLAMLEEEETALRRSTEQWAKLLAERTGIGEWTLESYGTGTSPERLYVGGENIVEAGLADGVIQAKLARELV